MNPICQCCGGDLHITDESSLPPNYCEACGQHSGAMCAALKESHEGWMATDRSARDSAKRYEFFRSEVERIAQKYVEFYSEQDMPNTSSAFDEILQLARAGRNDE